MQRQRAPFSGSAPTLAHVLSVVSNGGTDVTWTFDTNVASVDAGSLADWFVNGDDPITGSIAAAKKITLSYPNDVGPGDAWSVDSSTSGVTFAGGISLAPASGVTT